MLKTQSTLKKLLVCSIIICSIISCGQATDNSPSTAEEINETLSEEKENEDNYWDQFKRWTKDSYKDSKKWVKEKWPDSDNWSADAIEKIGTMATDLGDEMKKVKINVFSLEDDKRFGEELYNEIHNNSEYSVLARERNLQQYERVENIIQDVLNSGKVEHEKDFDWILTIIDDDKTVNAMCAPGGYIFVYTGLLDFVDNNSELAGVIAHEIAHADKRHGTRQLTAVYGVQLLISFLTDSDSELGAQIAAGLLNLRHSRKHEREADEYSVLYLCNTNYDADGIGQFFSKFEDQGDNKIEALISTHPNHTERIDNVQEHASEFGCL